MTQTELRCTGATCKATIVWDELQGRPHPFDRLKCKRCDGKGTITSLVGSFFEEGPQPGATACTRCKGSGTTLRSHFESCSDASKFRKVKR